MYDELIKNLRHDSASALQNCEFDFVHGWMLQAADAIEELQRRKHGKWLDVTTLDNEFICWVCSECRHGADFVYEPYNYCPNCGARMVTDDV